MEIVIKHLLTAIYTEYETSVHNDSDWQRPGKCFAENNDALWLEFKSLE